MTPKQIRRAYIRRIRDLLQEFKFDLRELGYTCSATYDMTDEDYAYAFIAKQRDREFEVKFVIAESEHWDGEENGVNFMVNMAAKDGRIIAELIPYNFTDEAWVSRDNPEAIEFRFALVEEAGGLARAVRFFDW